MKQQVNRLVNEPDLIIYDKKNKKIKAYKNKDDADEESEEDEGELLDFDVMTEIIDSEKHAIKNLLMTSQIKRRNMAEVILKARRRSHRHNGRWCTGGIPWASGRYWWCWLG